MASKAAHVALFSLFLLQGALCPSGQASPRRSAAAGNLITLAPKAKHAPKPLPEPSVEPTTDQQNNPFNQQSFVPAISLIVDTSLGGHSLGNEDFAALRDPFNLEAPGGEVEGINLANGFNLNFAEMTLSAPIDPFLDLFTVFHLHPSEFEIEEAYATTRGLPFNLTLKAGKFLSHFGRINPQHSHFWSFNEAPLVNQAFFGAEGLNELGARLSWLAPTPFYLDLGLEALQGANSSSFGNQGFSAGTNTIAPVNLPDLVVGTLKTSVDLLDNLVLLGGLSFAAGGSRFLGADTPEASPAPTPAEPELGDGSLANFAGSTQVGGADLSLRWFIDSYNELSWQSEFLFRHLSGQVYEDQGAKSLEKFQSGFYSQLLWRFGQQWRTGVRLDLLTQNQTVENAVSSAGPAMLPRYTAMVEFLPSEFTRLRLEYNLDQSRFLDGAQQTVHGVFLNLNLAMGAHGAHAF